MTRPIRLDPEGGWHHVMNRGANRQRTFFTSDDRIFFLSLLHEGCELFGVEVHAYCLMPNHFHLLLHLPNAGLSAFMQRLGSRYTRYVNERRCTDGALFRGRFRSIVVDDASYRSVVGRYIHRNPIALGRDGAPFSHRWSSLRYYLNGSEGPSWLRTEVLLDFHTSRRTFRDFTLGSPDVAPSASIVAWAIDNALHEAYEEAERELNEKPLLQRTVAAIMLTIVRPDQADLIAAINDLLQFPSVGARDCAMYRARRRVQETPVVNDVAVFALQLCDLSRSV